MNLGLAVKKARKYDLPGFTQKEFADMLGISPGHLSQVELGTKSPSIELLKRVSLFTCIPTPIIVFWAIDESDITPSKREDYNRLKPAFEKLINGMI